MDWALFFKLPIVVSVGTKILIGPGPEMGVSLVVSALDSDRVGSGIEPRSRSTTEPAALGFRTLDNDRFKVHQSCSTFIFAQDVISRDLIILLKSDCR